MKHNTARMHAFSIKGLLIDGVVIAIGIALAANILPGINYDSITTLALVVLVISLLNLFLKPLLILFTLPFILLTFGIGILLINAVLFILASKMISGFYVESFWAAFFGALIVSVVTFASKLVLKAQTVNHKARSKTDTKNLNDDDIIDI